MPIWYGMEIVQKQTLIKIELSAMNTSYKNGEIKENKSS